MPASSSPELPGSAPRNAPTMSAPLAPARGGEPRRRRPVVTHRMLSYRSGEVLIAEGRTPRGAIAMFEFFDRRAALVAGAILEVVARHAYKPGALLVPGIPEAASDDAALDALIRFTEEAAKRLRRRIPTRRWRCRVRTATTERE